MMAAAVSTVHPDPGLQPPPPDPAAGAVSTSQPSVQPNPAPINSKTLQTTSAANEHAPHQSSYPFLPLSFIMLTATLQGSFIGAQAILEMFFSRFVFVCSGTKSKTLGTIAVNIFIAVNQFTSLTGGLLADWILGNFHTQNLSNLCATVGVALVFLASWQYTIHQPHCCQSTINNNVSSPAHDVPDDCRELNRHTFLTSWSIGIPPEVTVVLIIIGCVLLSVGNGQTNAIQSVFVGDQFPEGQSEAKEKSFSWFYFFQNVGSLCSESGMPFSRQSIGFVIAFLITTGAYGLSTVIFAIGFCFYIRKPPPNSIGQCCTKQSHEESKPLLESNRSTTGEDRKQFLRICGVYVPLIAFWALFFQQNSTWVLQGAMMNCYIGKLHLPPDMMPSINDLMVIVLIPTLDYIAYPHLKSSMNLHIKPLQKIMAGMVCVALSFLFAALLQLYIPGPPLVSCRGEVSIMWQIPQLLLVSFAEVFVAVTGLEFAYSQSPPQMRNLIKALFCITQALGAALNAAIALINLSLLYQFILFTVLMVLILCVFLAINWNYKYR